MFVRIGCTAFLFHHDKVLLIKRSPHKKIAPGMWSGVGGHAEPHELNDPLATIYREVYEETGIAAADIRDLQLRYIILRKVTTNDEIRLSYFYFGDTTRTEVGTTSEGELFWVDKETLADYQMSGTVQEVVEHYCREGQESSAIFVGVVTEDEIVKMQWTELGDYENGQATGGMVCGK